MARLNPARFPGSATRSLACFSFLLQTHGSPDLRPFPAHPFLAVTVNACTPAGTKKSVSSYHWVPPLVFRK